MQFRIAAVSALVISLYVGVIPELVREWITRPAASHGMLIPPLAAYWIWLRRKDIRRFPVAPDNRGLMLIFFACGLFLTGTLGAEVFLVRISLIFMIAGLIYTFWGWPRLRALMFALLLLATTIPIPALLYNTVAGPLQLLASRTATGLSRFLGIVVHREGNVIHLATMTLGVAEACSGLNSLSTLVLTALLMNSIYPLTHLARICLVLIAPPLAIALNVLRVTGTSVLADWKPELALGFYHSLSGWAVFLAAFLFLLGVARLLRDYRFRG